MPPQTYRRLLYSIERMAADGKVVSLDFERDHENPIVRFRLSKPRNIADGQARVVLEDLVWSPHKATLRRQRSIEDALELHPVHYLGTPVPTLAKMLGKGWLKAA